MQVFSTPFVILPSLVQEVMLKSVGIGADRPGGRGPSFFFLAVPKDVKKVSNIPAGRSIGVKYSSAALKRRQIFQQDVKKVSNIPA